MRSRNLILVIMLIGSIMLSTSCASTPKTVVVHDVPDVEFPVFPDPDPVVLNGDTVSMPLWYFTKIAEYKADVDKVEAYLNELRKLNENKK